MNNRSSSLGVLEYVNLALAIFSWLFSDIEFYIKVIITLVLVSIIVFSRLGWGSWLRNLSIKPVIILYGFPIVSSFAMYQVARFCYSRSFFEHLSDSEPLFVVSLIYGLLVALPIVLIGAILSKYNFHGFNLGPIFSFIWVASILLLASIGENISIWKISFLGPIVYGYLGDQCGLGYPVNFSVLAITSIGLFLILTIFYYFGVIWRMKNDSL